MVDQPRRVERDGALGCLDDGAQLLQGVCAKQDVDAVREVAVRDVAGDGVALVVVLNLHRDLAGDLHAGLVECDGIHGPWSRHAPLQDRLLGEAVDELPPEEPSEGAGVHQYGGVPVGDLGVDPQCPSVLIRQSAGAWCGDWLVGWVGVGAVGVRHGLRVPSPGAHDTSRHELGCPAPWLRCGLRWWRGRLHSLQCRSAVVGAHAHQLPCPLCWLHLL